MYVPEILATSGIRYSRIRADNTVSLNWSWSMWQVNDHKKIVQPVVPKLGPERLQFI